MALLIQSHIKKLIAHKEKTNESFINQKNNQGKGQIHKKLDKKHL